MDTNFKEFDYEVTISGTIRISQELLNSVLTDEWRSQMYSDITEPKDVADHLIYNIICNNIDNITMLDGFADRNKDDVEWDSECTHIDIIEL